MSSGNNEVIIKLGGDESYVEEMEEVLKIEEYRRSRNIAQLPENIQNILNNKQAEVKDRRRRVRGLLEDALKNSTFFIKGTQVDIKGSTVQEKMNEAFKVLVENIYKHLPLIQEFTNQESDLKAFLVADNDQITLDDAVIESPNAQAKQMIDEFIRLQAELNKQIRIKPIYDRYTDAPYGWRELDIAGIIAELLKEQRIRIRYNAEYLEPREDANTLMTVFTRTKEADKAVIVVRQKVDESLLRSVKRIARDLFNKRDLADDEDGLIKDIRHLIEMKEEEIDKYKKRYEDRKYPGMSLLDKGLEYFSQFDRGIDNLTFFKRFKELEDDLGDWFDDIQYVKSFFDTNQQSIYDKGLQAMETYEEVKAYVQTEEVENAMNQLHDILNDPIPYNRIKDIPKLVHVLDEQINTVLTEKKETAREKIQLDFDEASLQANQYGVSNRTKEQIDIDYKNMLALLNSYTDLFKVDAAITRSNSYKIKAIQDIQREITEWQRQKELEQKKRTKVTEPVSPIEPAPEPEPVIQKETVKLSELITVRTLSTEEDVDKYVSTLSNKLKQIIKSNKEIELKE